MVAGSQLTSVWRMTLWRDSAHPRVLQSDTAIAGALRPQRTLGATDKRVSWYTDSLPPSESSNSGEPLPDLGAADKRVSWHSDYLPLPEASNSGEPLPALFPNSGEPLQSPQSEKTLALQQHSQATDSENFDDDDHHHVEEYIIREHNDKQVGSDGTVAWEPKVRHLHHITALLTTCPAGLPVQPQQALPAAQTAYHTRLATQESAFRPARHLRFHTEHAAQTPPSQLERGRQKQRQRRSSRTHAHTEIIEHQLEVYSTRVCPSVLQAPCSHPESCTRCAYVGKECNVASTRLP